MAQPAHTTAGTEVPAEPGGFPPFKTETYPSQLFWLTITFAVLFVVMWRVALPRLHSVVNDRKGRIDGDIAAAQKSRSDAETASQAYDAALSSARKRAQALANESRQAINAEVDKARAKADAESHALMAEAEKRIGASRDAARQHVEGAAQDAAIAIVARLTGDQVAADEAVSAVRASQA